MSGAPAGRPSTSASSASASTGSIRSTDRTGRVEVLVEQFVERSGQVEREQPRKPVGRKARAFEGERLTVRKPDAHDLDRAVRRAGRQDSRARLDSLSPQLLDSPLNVPRSRSSFGCATNEPPLRPIARRSSPRDSRVCSACRTVIRLTPCCPASSRSPAAGRRERASSRDRLLDVRDDLRVLHARIRSPFGSYSGSARTSAFTQSPKMSTASACRDRRERAGRRRARCSRRRRSRTRRSSRGRRSRRLRRGPAPIRARSRADRRARGRRASAPARASASRPMKSPLSRLTANARPASSGVVSAFRSLAHAR